jgi:hypothetical protein
VNPWRVSTRLRFTAIRNQRPTDPAGGGGNFNPFTTTTIAGGTITWEAFAIEPVNGIDDNNDGLIDEAGIRRTHDWTDGATPVNDVLAVSSHGTSRWLAPSLPAGQTSTRAPPRQPGDTAPAITFALVDPDNTLPNPPTETHVTVTVTLQGVDSRGNRMTRSQTATVALRNRP